jgi:hypothetical protein
LRRRRSGQWKMRSRGAGKEKWLRRRRKRSGQRRRSSDRRRRR